MAHNSVAHEPINKAKSQGGKGKGYKIFLCVCTRCCFFAHVYSIFIRGHLNYVSKNGSKMSAENVAVGYNAIVVPDEPPVELELSKFLYQSFDASAFLDVNSWSQYFDE